jgi:predicted nuclease with RNAse H fold
VSRALGRMARAIVAWIEERGGVVTAAALDEEFLDRPQVRVAAFDAALAEAIAAGALAREGDTIRRADR